MNSEKSRVLEMLSEGKINADEAERLLGAIVSGPHIGNSSSIRTAQRSRERVRVEVEPEPEVELEDTRDDRFTVGPASKVVVQGNNGDVSVSPGPEGEVRVLAEIAHPERVDYQVSQDGDTVNVQVKRKKGSSKLFDFFTGEGRVDIEVTAPPGAEVDVKTANGDIGLEGAVASAKLGTANGDVSVVNAASPLDLGSTNGDVSVERSTGPMKLRTVNGDVSAKESAGVFDAGTVNGSVTLEVEMTGDGKNRIRTINGGIKVGLWGEPSLTVDASCVAGSISTEVPGLSVSGTVGKRLTGTLGSGEAELDIHTVSGSISIR